MKIVISQQGIKREIEGPFEICIGADDLRTLIERLKEKQEGWSYGWITIYEKPHVQPSMKPTLPWTETP